jgi:hypothetical protein
MANARQESGFPSIPLNLGAAWSKAARSLALVTECRTVGFMCLKPIKAMWEQRGFAVLRVLGERRHGELERGRAHLFAVLGTKVPTCGSGTTRQ